MPPRRSAARGRLELGLPARLHQHLHTIRPGHEFGFRWLPFAIGVAYPVLRGIVLFKLKKGPERPVVTWAAGITVMSGLLAVRFAGWADTAKSYRSVFVVGFFYSVLPHFAPFLPFFDLTN